MKAKASSAKYVLAVDLGTSGAKVALIGVDGRVAAWENEPVALHVLPGGGAEQALRAKTSRIDLAEINIFLYAQD